MSETDGGVQARSVAVHDFVHPDHRLAAGWPVLETLHQRFASDLARRLGERFRLSVEASCEPIRNLRHPDFLAPLDARGIVHELELGAVPGVVLLCLDADLVPTLVDGWFGGTLSSSVATGSASRPDADAEAENGQSGAGSDADGGTDGGTAEPPRVDASTSPAVPSSPGSATERRALAYVLEAVIKALSTGWSEIASLSPSVVRATTVARLARGGYSDVVIDCPFTLRSRMGVRRGRMVYAASTIEPYAAKLSREAHARPLQESAFREALRGELMGCELELRGVLAETRVTLSELMAMRSGDFIPLKDVQNVSFRTRETPLFEARVGRSNGRVSASLSRWHLPLKS